MTSSTSIKTIRPLLSLLITLVLINFHPFAAAAEPKSDKTDQSHSVAESVGPTPSPALSPEDVIRIQLEALRNNNKPYANAGIEITFRFASPGNKQVTGPLGHFATLFDAFPYNALLDFDDVQFEPILRVGNKASQLVILTLPSKKKIAYLWQVSRQQEGDFNGCWMTDGVVPLLNKGNEKEEDESKIFT